MEKKVTINLLRDKSCDYCSEYCCYNGKEKCWIANEPTNFRFIIKDIPEKRTCEEWSKK